MRFFQRYATTAAFRKAGISVSRVPTYQQPRWAVVWISSEHNC
jgi:hypothetical protein